MGYCLASLHQDIRSLVRPHDPKNLTWAIEVACVEEAMKHMRGYKNTQRRGESSGFRYQGGGGVIPYAGAFRGTNSAQASNGGTRNSQGSMSSVANQVSTDLRARELEPFLMLSMSRG